MLDLYGLLDRATNIFKGSDFDQILGEDPAGRLSELGLDASLLNSVQLDEVQSFLEKSGLDLHALSESQAGDLIAAVNENGGIDGLDLSKILGQSSN